MKIRMIIAASSAVLLFSTSAIAQSFTYDVLWEPVESIGGMTGADGPQGGGGVVNGSYTTKYADGSVQRGSVRCVGMDQPDNGMFDIHLSCTAKDSDSSASLIYGCNFLGKRGPETPLGCVGGIEGKTGGETGRRGSLTMEWYSDTQSRGTGQWYGGE